MKIFCKSTSALKKRFSNFLNNSGGNVTLIFGLAAIPVVATAGVAIDYSRAISAKQDLQAIADAAALAAAAPKNASIAERKQIAFNYIENNKAVIGDGTELSRPNIVVGPNTIDIGLEARVKGTLSSVLTAGVVAAANTNEPRDPDLKVGSHAKTAFANDSYMCLLALHPTDYQAVRFYGNSEFMAKVCTVRANSNNRTAMITMGSAYAEAQDFCAVGGWSGSGFEPDPTGGCMVNPDPYANLTLPTVGSCNWTNKRVDQHQTANLTPGVYCGGIELRSHSTANLAPGTYIIKDGALDFKIHSTINAPGVTFFLAGNSSINVTSGANVTISAPTSDDPSNPYDGITSMAIIQKANSNPGVTNVISSGGNVNITGAYYTPKQNLQVWANGDMNLNSPYFPMVVNKFEMSGNATLYVKLDWAAAGLPEPVELKSARYVTMTQ